jgi:iron complex transport system ATP-binding protein
MTSPTDSGAPLDVRWSGVSVDLGGRQVVDDLDLLVEGGSWTTIIGPNGAGKTTLLRALSGTAPYRGTITIGPDEGVGLGRRERARRLAVVPQHPVIPPGLDVFDYALLGRSPHQGVRFAASEDDRRRTSAVLERLGLTDFAHRFVDSLSGGERQRVVVARALVQDAPVLVLDEPTSFLDLGHQMDVLELIAELRAERSLTVVCTLHDLTVVGQFADRIAVLDDGHLAEHGTPGEVLTPSVISRYWGVDVRTEIHDDTSVSVSVRRRER